jgi:4-carboxymuconolactone decarboxylase
VTVIDYEERRQRGRDLYTEIMGREAPPSTSPRSAALLDFVYAEIWSRDGISRRERRLITLACAAGADGYETLADHVYGALVTGDLTYDELQEVILQFAVYCGWAKAEAFERILDEQWALLHAERGTPVPACSDEALTSVPADQELRKQGGEQEFRDVNWFPAPPRGVPYYDAGILNYVFGDMWKRPGLSRRDRRWVTVACVGLDDSVGPIQSHVYSAMRSGDITFDEMRELVLQFAAYSGWPKGSFLQQTVDAQYARVVEETGTAS